MKRALTAALAALTFFTAVPNIYAINFYYTEDEYNEALVGTIYEDRGLVIENHPMLGYLTYKNKDGAIVTAPYYTSDLAVEKQNIEEIEDRVGYIDELFPSFEYDGRDTTIENIKPGDNIYLRTDSQGYIQYISAYVDYTMRYGQINNIRFLNQGNAEITFTDEEGQFFRYITPISTFATKLGRPISLSSIRPGEWAKFLLSRKHLGHGIIEEDVIEIVVDPDSRIVNDIYKGNVLQLGGFDNTLKLADARLLEQTGFGQYIDIATFNTDPRNFNAYIEGTRTSFDYVSKYISGSDMTAYVAIENFLGRDSVAKMSLSDGFTKSLDPNMVVDVSATEIRLLGGDVVIPNADSIIIKGERLVSPANILVGDTIQAVIDSDDNLLVAKTVENIGQGPLTIYRGTIKKIDDHDLFVVETFSLLKNDEWHYHPQPRTFALDNDTRFYVDEEGFNADGLNEFLDYGPTTEMSEIFTIVADGDRAIAVSKIPYTREVAKGEIFDADDDGNVSLKDVFYYNVDENLWRQLDQTNLGVQFTMLPGSLIIKNGELVDSSKLEKGDKVSVMLTDELLNLIDDANGGGDDDEAPQVDGYIMLVK
ncbi:hypothetical protein [Candidatus Epulonipiscium viviparus]|uniref:hypothetical protein n=1 Tax=Candidatus Epulonipiscium viviparus TaxID=420336 RepID=UPI0027380FD3|nr:hypothetical protein [Candidatus Epulopiscium viviparus]